MDKEDLKELAEINLEASKFLERLDRLLVKLMKDESRRDALEKWLYENA